MTSVLLRQRLDHLIATFTNEVLRALARSRVAHWQTPARPAPKPAPKGKAFPAPRASKAAPNAVAKPPRKSGTQRVAPAVVPRAAAPLDAAGIERALLTALKSAPILGQADLLDAAGLGAEVNALAQQVIDALLARDVLGSAAMGGTPLLFAKSRTKTAGRPRGGRSERTPRSTAPITPIAPITSSLVEPATPEIAPEKAADPTPAPEPWRPTVIRRKKAIVAGS